LLCSHQFNINKINSLNLLQKTTKLPYKFLALPHKSKNYVSSLSKSISGSA
jgi:hypothetical protein